MLIKPISVHFTKHTHKVYGFVAMDSFTSNPILHHHHHHSPLDFQAVLQLPDSHTWTLPAGDHPSTSAAADPVPVVDLSDPHASVLIRDACESWGVFQVTNHGITTDLFNDLEYQTHRLFSLPTSRKILAARSPEGLTGYGMARISTFFPKLMWHEGFTIVGSPAEHAGKIWPHDDGHSPFCSVMEEYQNAMEGVTERIVELMIKSLVLGLKGPKWFRPKQSVLGQGLLQLNSYPMCPEPGRTVGLAPHTDSSIVTLLYQSSIGGLQVHKENVGWVHVEPISGALVVNVGDLMHIISNGRFKSVVHRAVVNKTSHRISAAYFYGPPKDVEVSPLMDGDDRPVYHPVTWREYLDAKATHFNKALELFRCDHAIVDSNI